MRHYAKVQREALVKNTCDKCGKEIKVSLPYDVFKSSFTIRQGNNYNGDDCSETLYIDLCQDCTVSVKQLLINNGCKFNEEY